MHMAPMKAKEKMAPGLGSGELIGCFGLTEANLVPTLVAWLQLQKKMVIIG